MTIDSQINYYDQIIFDGVMRKWYGGTDFYNVGYWTDQIATQAEASTALVDRMLNGVEGHVVSVLDVGCGLGATTAYIKQRWPLARVTGLNLSETQVNHCRVNVSNCEFVVMDAADITLPDESFDLVISVEAAYHFETRQDFLKQAYRILKPGGTLALADILFDASHEHTKALSIWDVAHTNNIQGPLEYSEILAGIGFADPRIEDATEQTWRTWLKRLTAWTEQKFPETDAERLFVESWQKGVPKLLEAVRYYLLVTARK